jgi:hypothetical protein
MHCHAYVYCPLTVGIFRLCYRTVSCIVMLMFPVPPDSWHIQTLLQNRVMHCHAYVYFPLIVGIFRLCYRTMSCIVMLMFTVP